MVFNASPQKKHVAPLDRKHAAISPKACQGEDLLECVLESWTLCVFQLYVVSCCIAS